MGRTLLGCRLTKERLRRLITAYGEAVVRNEQPAEKSRVGRAAPDIAEDLASVADSRGPRCRLRIRWRGELTLGYLGWDEIVANSDLTKVLREILHSVTREGPAEDEPAAYALINAMRLDEDQIGSLVLTVNEAEDPEAGVRRWLEEKKTRELVRPWIEAAKNAQEEK